MTFPRLVIVILLCLWPLGQPAAAERLDVFDLELGTSADSIAPSFIELACGTNGGPPSAPVAGFTDFAACPAEPDGLHEVYFQYDDEMEFVGRALGQAYVVEQYRGTRVLGFDAIVSALFDDAGVLRGIRIATDPRGVPEGDRNDHWRLGDLLRRHYGEAGWTCRDEELAPEETPVSTFAIKRTCEKTADGFVLTTSQNYFHRRGEHFTDEFGKVQPTHFTSTTLFELRQQVAEQ